MIMKKTLLITILALLGITQAMAQEYEYVPFVREGVKWVYYINYPEWSNPNPNFNVGLNYRTLEIKGDVVINGKTYKAMHKYSGDAIDPHNDTIPIYLREEDNVVYGIIPDGKMYYDCPIKISWLIDEYNGEEFVLYDFNDQESFWDGILNIDFDDCYEFISTQFITLGSHRAKQYVNKYNGTDFYFIEGIGIDTFTNGFMLYPFMGQLLSGPMFHLSHVIENDEIVYKSVNYLEPEPDDYEYVPFVREGVKWVYAISDYQWYDYDNNPANGDFIAHRTLELRGDTVINGKLYKAMHKCVDDEISEPSDVVPIYLREKDKKVYGIVPDCSFFFDAPIGDFCFGTEEYFNAISSGEEFLLYDFLDPVAYWDSVYHHSAYDFLEHLYTDTIEIGHHKAKRYRFGHYGDFQIIEGIGLIGYNSYPLGFFLPISTGVHGEYFWLETVIEDGEVIYGSERDKYMPLIREGVKWVNERVVVNNGDTTCYYYTYEFKGNHPRKGDYNRTYKALYRYDGRHHELDVECDSLVAGLREDWRDVTYFCNEPLNLVISQGRDLIEFDQGFLYELPIMIEDYPCSRLAYLNEQGDTAAYIIEGIGFDSYDMGDLLTPFTRKPDPDADYQEYCGLSHVVKDGKIIYKGMRYNPALFENPGDVNGDGEVNIADANSVIDIVILGGNAGHTRAPAADANHDGEVNIGDINYIINFILNGE